MVGGEAIKKADGLIVLTAVKLKVVKLAHLKILLAVAQEGSFSEAALVLDISQAAVSYAVAQLEAHLGVRLFERGHYGAKLTDVGKRIAVHARGMIALEQALEQEAGLERGLIAGELRVLAFRSAAGKIVAPLVAHLKVKHPALQIRLKELDNEGGVHKMHLVRARQADLAFVDGNVEGNELITWEVMRDRYIALLPTTDARELVCWHELTSENLILSTGHNTGNRVERHFASMDRTVVPAYEVHEDSTIAGLVKAGLGIGLLPAFAADALPEGVKGVPTDVTLERPIYICLLPESIKLPVVRVFLNALRTAFPASEVPLLDI